MGLDLTSPIILTSSGMTASLERIKEAEAAGAGAVVLKSIFEEQIMHEIAHQESYSDYPEASDYLRHYIEEHNLGGYLELIRKAKEETQMPIIASINCQRAGEWIDYARQIEEAGADAIELNIFLLPTDKDVEAAEIEARYLEIATQVKETVEIPVSVKLGPAFTNLLSMVKDLYYRNINGVVFFNRFYPIDIDVERMEVKVGAIYSQPTELSNILRWTAFVNGYVPLIDVAVSTGVHSGEDAVKALLAGASAVGITSAIYQKGFGVIGEMNQYIIDWMNRHDYQMIQDFTGRLNAKNIANPTLYERTQFMRYYSNHE